jgi:hypothetical protein
VSYALRLVTLVEYVVVPFPWLPCAVDAGWGSYALCLVTLVADVECAFVLFFLGSLVRWTLGG